MLALFRSAELPFTGSKQSAGSIDHCIHHLGYTNRAHQTRTQSPGMRVEFRTRHEYHAEVTLNATGFQRESDPVRLRIRELNLRDQQVNVVPVEIVPRRHTIIARGHCVTDASKRRGERNEKPRIIMGYECVHQTNPIKMTRAWPRLLETAWSSRFNRAPKYRSRKPHH
jgi:hypothetical protein